MLDGDSRVIPLAVTVYFTYNGDSERSKYKFRTVECTEVEKLLRPPRPPPCLFFPSYLLSEHVTVCRKAASWNFLTPL